MENGMVFDIRRYSIHDGPGIRTTIFFKGCPLRCWWCHNPEGQNPQPELVYRDSRCTGCGECVRSCQAQAISLKTGNISLNRKKCVLCNDCSKACPSEALSVAGKRVTVKEVLEEVDKDMPFYEESNGGVTFSGGEPLLQPSFLNALLDECKKKEIHTTLDTCGFAPYKTIERILDKVDLFLYDLKTMNTEIHRKYTGSSNERILGNLKKLAEHGGNIVISFPVMPCINDDEKNIAETAEFVSSLPNVLQLNLLPYHKAGIEKYKSLGKPYKLDRIRSPSSQSIESIKEKMEASGITVGIGGG